ncbi:ceramidase domain-containing protein [Methylobacterium sp. J-090]|uniref:ceramidase domain-containing protein n=1 Tax=Methylobacterium sp. J-090 TaxID=2836666 RepID=UPI001FB90245|nr:ceramidase domain-containing protein [Methylobacterium sp. J-090]MCJ2080976.1 ceramidase [Methylobacterium sp. J-090]
MDETWFAPVCAYCERADGSFWAEPVNALSNVAFLIAAGAVAWRERRGARPDPVILVLAGLVAVIGLGSFLFHTLAVRWSLLADVIPIAAFIHAYFFLAMRRFFAFGPGPALAATLLFAAFGFGLEPALDILLGPALAAATNGSIAYVPAILALVGVGAGLLVPQRGGRDPARYAAGTGLLAIAGLFALSLAFRTLDRSLCASLPLGTHFLWHILNAGVLSALLVTALRYRSRRG